MQRAARKRRPRTAWVCVIARSLPPNRQQPLPQNQMRLPPLRQCGKQFRTNHLLEQSLRHRSRTLLEIQRQYLRSLQARPLRRA